jgi:hypothetical protein
VKKVSVFLPGDTWFYRRLFLNLKKAFIAEGLEVSGGCVRLDDIQIRNWVKVERPDFIFEMNRVKNEIPVLHDLKVPHISWVVDFGGRSEQDIRGSDITYFFDSGWDDNYEVGGFQDWFPPAVCIDSFYPHHGLNEVKSNFSFIGHIPLPWSDSELDRPIFDAYGKESGLRFGELLQAFSNRMELITYKNQTHATLLEIIRSIAFDITGVEVVLPRNICYDLLERVKRVKNRTSLIKFAMGKSNSIEIYGSENWRAWHEFGFFYKHFISSAEELNIVHQVSKCNLHDGLDFHFRSIECMASGGMLLWYNENSGDKYGQVKCIGRKRRRGLHDYFVNMENYIGFHWNEFDDVYDRVCSTDYFGSKNQKRTVDIIKAEHTWNHRVRKILNDLALI